MTLQNIYPPKRTFEHNGKSYNVRTLDEAVRSQYEETCYQSELKKLDKVAALYTEQELRRRKRKLADAYLARKFRLDKGNMNLDQGLLLVTLLFQCSDEEAIMLMSERGEDIQELFRIGQKQALGDVKEGSGEKKVADGQTTQTISP